MNIRVVISHPPKLRMTTKTVGDIMHAIDGKCVGIVISKKHADELGIDFEVNKTFAFEQPGSDEIAMDPVPLKRGLFTQFYFDCPSIIKS
jgi:hypothetical protein